MMPKTATTKATLSEERTPPPICAVILARLVGVRGVVGVRGDWTALLRLGEGVERWNSLACEEKTTASTSSSSSAAAKSDGSTKVRRLDCMSSGDRKLLRRLEVAGLLLLATGFILLPQAGLLLLAGSFFVLPFLLPYVAGLSAKVGRGLASAGSCRKYEPPGGVFLREAVALRDGLKGEGARGLSRSCVGVVTLTFCFFTDEAGVLANFCFLIDEAGDLVTAFFSLFLTGVFERALRFVAGARAVDIDSSSCFSSSSSSPSSTM
jgi:hypothetical protein